MSRLPELLPLFPLNLVLYPDEPVPLHIFEPRYREMVRYCLDEEVPFGVVYASESSHADVGCSARIRRILTRYDDGRLDLLAQGEDRFRIVEIFRDRAYLTAEVEPFGPAAEPGAVDVDARERMITQHLKLLEIAGEKLRPSAYEAARWASFVVARNAGLDLEDKQRLLEMPTENERVHFLVEHVGALLARVERARQINEIARGDGHPSGMPEVGGEEDDEEE
ncbi:MAG TPA: LON peptidase substrate-binding domain-containing protein [Rubricoccaceae bacterium]|nr:LON peptidase substrate-binding domain-containing protein [Rubricoccaceae bacterium]